MLQFNIYDKQFNFVTAKLMGKYLLTSLHYIRCFSLKDIFIKFAVLNLSLINCCIILYQKALILTFTPNFITTNELL